MQPNTPTEGELDSFQIEVYSCTHTGKHSHQGRTEQTSEVYNCTHTAKHSQRGRTEQTSEVYNCTHAAKHSHRGRTEQTSEVYNCTHAAKTLPPRENGNRTQFHQCNCEEDNTDILNYRSQNAHMTSYTIHTYQNRLKYRIQSY